MYFQSLLLHSPFSTMQKPIYNDDILAMEKLPINNGGGQGYGFLLYRTRVKTKPTTLALSRSPRDRAQVLYRPVKTCRFGRAPSYGIISITAGNICNFYILLFCNFLQSQLDIRVDVPCLLIFCNKQKINKIIFCSCTEHILQYDITFQCTFKELWKS